MGRICGKATGKSLGGPVVLLGQISGNQQSRAKSCSQVVGDSGVVAILLSLVQVVGDLEEKKQLPLTAHLSEKVSPPAPTIMPDHSFLLLWPIAATMPRLGMTESM